MNVPREVQLCKQSMIWHFKQELLFVIVVVAETFVKKENEKKSLLEGPSLSGCYFLMMPNCNHNLAFETFPSINSKFYGKFPLNEKELFPGHPRFCCLKDILRTHTENEGNL